MHQPETPRIARRSGRRQHAMRSRATPRSLVPKPAQQVLDCANRHLPHDKPADWRKVIDVMKMLRQVNFPTLRLTSGFSYGAPPSTVPITTACIYANVAWARGKVVGVRVGSTGAGVGARNRFRQHAAEARRLSGTTHFSRTSSPYLAAVHRLPIEAWRFVILDDDPSLADESLLHHREHLFMDALRDQTMYGDFNATDPCKLSECRRIGAHRYQCKYVR